MDGKNSKSGATEFYHVLIETCGGGVESTLSMMLDILQFQVHITLFSFSVTFK